MKPGIGAFALVCLLEAWPREASADGETVRVELPSCATLCFDALDFVRLVSLELRADGRVVLDSSSSELAGELGGYVRELVFTGVGTPVASFAGFTGGITVGFTYDL